MKIFGIVSLILTTSIWGLPSGHNVTHGSATLSHQGKHLHITTNEKAIIHWKDFSINTGEVVQFIQPNKGSAVLNRVKGGNPSQIFGTLKGNGSVYLINKHGVIIGEKGHVETGSFLASTLDVLDHDFLTERDMKFNGNSEGGITHLGTIDAWDGSVTLLGFTVVNQGAIKAQNTNIGAGVSIILKPEGEGIFINAASGDTADVGIEHQGTIHSLKTHLRADGNLYALAIKDDGIIDASGFTTENGRVFLTSEKGKVEVAGKVTAPGGSVAVVGKEVGLIDQGHISVSSQTQGGTISLGDPKITAALFVGPESFMEANALQEGNGGKIITWGQGVNRFYGTASAKGGMLAGNGGLVEVSTRGSYDFYGKGDVTAPKGETGIYFLDPTDITLSAAADTGGVVPGTPNYTIPALATVNIDVSATGPLVTLLNGGNNVTISTNTAGPSGGTLTVVDAFNWAGAATLTLISNSNMAINNQINTGGVGNLVLNSGAGISITTPGSIIGGLGFITLTAVGDILLNPSFGFIFNNGPGAINVSSQGNVILNSGFIFTTNGDINVTAANDVRIQNNSIIQEFGVGNNLNVIAGNNILLQNNGTISSLEAELLLIAGRDVRIEQSSRVAKTGPGDLTIVCDNDFPTFPQQGPGAFILDSSSIVNHTGSSGPIHTPGPIRIFTSARAQNMIDGQIRGLPFSPGTYLIDSNTERWCTYFDNTFNAFPFTIFYKECVEELVILFQSSSAPIVTVESLRDFHPYDEYLGWPLFFDFIYRSIERSPIPYFIKDEKKGINTPKEKAVETFNFSEYETL